MILWSCFILYPFLFSHYNFLLYFAFISFLHYKKNDSSCYCDKIYNKSTLKNEGLILAHRLKIQFITLGKTWWLALRQCITLHSQTGSREQRMLALSSLSSFNWSRTSVHEMVLPTVKVDLRTLFNLIWIISHRKVQRISFEVILDPVKFTNIVITITTPPLVKLLHKHIIFKP